MRYLCTCLHLFILVIVTTSLRAMDPVYVEDNGLIVIEPERAFAMANLSNTGFELRKDLQGYTGAGYLFWNGGNRYGGPGSDVLRFRLVINTPGRYTLAMHVSSKGAAKHDLNNDCWLRMDEGKWYKTFQASTEGWKWGGRFDHHPDGKPEAHYELSAGEHILQLTGRSQGFHIDRIHLFRENRKSDAKSLSHRETNNIPVPPKSLTQQNIRDAWFAGKLGAVWSWADKTQEKDQEAADAVTVLSKSFDQQIAEVEDQFAKNKLQAFNQLIILIEQWDGAPREPRKKLKDMHKTWSKDKALKNEIKANSVVQKLIALRNTKDPEQAKTIEQGEAILVKKYGETNVVQEYLARYK